MVHFPVRKNSAQTQAANIARVSNYNLPEGSEMVAGQGFQNFGKAVKRKT